MKTLFEGNVRLTAINSRRYLGNKYRLLPFISSVIDQHCPTVEQFADIFAGTGVVASLYTGRKLITNDLLYSNYQCHLAWFDGQETDQDKIFDLIADYNRTNPQDDNYMSDHFSDTYFSREVCQKIGFIREDIERRFLAKELNRRERAILITSLMYGMDKVANTCGHYDAWRQKLI